MKRLLLCLTALLALSGCADVTAQREPLSSNDSSSSGQSSGPGSSAMPAAGPGTIAPKAVSPTVPKRLRLDGMVAPVVPIGLTGSALTPPDDPRTLGWWGKRAGSRHGTTLLTGHTVHDGGGTFDDLELTPVGGRARLSGHSYQVTSVEVISKGQLDQACPSPVRADGTPQARARDLRGL